MPFKSEDQRKYLWANEPEIARRWAQETAKKKIEKKRKENAAKPRQRQNDRS